MSNPKKIVFMRMAIVPLLILCSSQVNAKHWVILPQDMDFVSGDTPSVFYFDKNSIRYDQQTNMGSVVYRDMFGVPFNQAEKMYYQGKANIDCNTGNISGDKITLYLYGIPTKSFTIEKFADKEEAKFFFKDFNYLLQYACHS